MSHLLRVFSPRIQRGGGAGGIAVRMVVGVHVNKGLTSFSSLT